MRAVAKAEPEASSAVTAGATGWSCHITLEVGNINIPRIIQKQTIVSNHIRILIHTQLKTFLKNIDEAWAQNNVLT